MKLISFFHLFIQRKGVKRQADTTTPFSGQPSPTGLPEVASVHTPVNLPLVPQRRESTRTIKRPKLELPGESSYGSGRRRPLSVQLRYCQSLIKELFSKKHQACAWPFYHPVDAASLGLHDYYDIIKSPMDMSTIKVCHMTSLTENNSLAILI